MESCEAHESRPFVKGLNCCSLPCFAVYFLCSLDTSTLFLSVFVGRAIRDSDAVVCAMHSGKVM